MTPSSSVRPARTHRRPFDVAVGIGSVLAALGATAVAYKTRVVATPGTGALEVAEPVSVLVPARNEAGRIADCVRSLLALRGVPDLEVLVLDDSSTDGTADVVLAAAAGDERLRVLAGEPLPPGSYGKPHACAQLAAAARGSVFVFVDADVRLAPHAVAAAVTMLRDRSLDLLSPFPRQVAGTPAERLYQPLAMWTWISSSPVLDARADRRHTGCSVNGQFVVVDRDAYAKAGGHGAVARELVEDFALGRVFHGAGLAGGAADGTHHASCRMYEGWADLRAGYTRWLGAMVGGRVRFAASLGVLVLAYVLPPTAALRGSRVGLAGYAAGVAGRAIAARRFGERVWPDAAAHRSRSPCAARWWSTAGGSGAAAGRRGRAGPFRHDALEEIAPPPRVTWPRLGRTPGPAGPPAWSSADAQSARPPG